MHNKKKKKLWRKNIRRIDKKKPMENKNKKIRKNTKSETKRKEKTTTTTISPTVYDSEREKNSIYLT